MSRTIILGALIAVGLALGGWALAQQQPPAAKVPPKAESGQFAVAPAGQSAVLLDTKTGKTWVLTHSVQGQSVWLPAKRIDSEEEAREWREYQKSIRRRLAEIEKVEVEKAKKE